MAEFDSKNFAVSWSKGSHRDGLQTFLAGGSGMSAEPVFFGRRFTDFMNLHEDDGSPTGNQRLYRFRHPACFKLPDP